MIVKKHQNELPGWPITPEQIKDAADRLDSFSPYLKKVFPEPIPSHGVIESELRDIPHMKEFLNENYNAGITGRIMLKMDSDLPCGIGGAPGGISYGIIIEPSSCAAFAMLIRPDDMGIYSSYARILILLGLSHADDRSLGHVWANNVYLKRAVT